MNLRSIISTIALFSVLTGCSTFRHKRDVVDQELANSIRELNSYAAMYAPQPETRTIRQMPKFDERVLPPGLIGRYTVRWYGDPEIFLNEMSRQGGFPFMVIGPRPVQPINIWLDEKSKPLYEILYQIGEQLGHQATLNLFVSPLKQAYRVNLVYPR